MNYSRNSQNGVYMGDYTGSTIGVVKGILGVQTVDYTGFRVSFGGAGGVFS